MTAVRKSSGRKKNRPTIGLLIGRLGDIGYAANVWPGIADAAAGRDANLICFVGGALNAPDEFDLQRNAIYDLVGLQNVDGLVVMSGSLGQFIGPERLLHFFKRFGPLPIVSIAMELEGVPSVLVENAAGMREAVTHLIEVHGFRRIAFLRGPATNLEAEERFRVYRETLAANDLPYDPALVAEGNFLAPAGVEAVRLFLDERKVDFEAVASANDEMALGALAALRRRGRRIPEDVRVVGFDNLEEARYAAPPLTTIRQPFYEQGRKATEILLDILGGKRAPARTILPTELVIRQSCGCFAPVPSPVAVGDGGSAAKKTGKPPALRRTRLLSDLISAAGASAQKADPGWAERLLDSLAASLQSEGSRFVFLHAWDDILRQVGVRGGDLTQWERVLWILRGQAAPGIGGGDISAMDPVWNQAEALMADVGQWSQISRRLQADRRAFEFMTDVSEPLMTSFDVAGLADVVAAQLPRMGIRACYLSLYDRTAEGGDRTPTEYSRLILGYNEDGRAALEPGGKRFLSRDLLPPGLLPRRKRFAVLLEPLHFRGEDQLGFIMFEPLQSEAGPLREAFSRQISTALKGAMLLQERRRAEDTLRAGRQMEREFQERLRTLLEVNNELSRADSVDALCRRAVELGLSKLGFDRMGIWFHNPELGVIEGSFGTDSQGNICDEREKRVKALYSPSDILRQTRPVTLLHVDVDLRDGRGKTIGRGTRAEAAMWDGVKTIGLVAVDNLIRHRPFSEYDREILNSFASALGYLCSRKRAEETLQAGQQEERRFEERLRTLVEISNKLSRTVSVDELSRLAVELGRSQFGFERMSIWFFDPQSATVHGSFGTDAGGEICDERAVVVPAEYPPAHILLQQRPVTLLHTDVELRDGNRNTIGRGDRAEAAMWDGEKTIGWVSVDNLLHHRTISERDCELLNLYASTLGYLTSRKRTEEKLRAGEQAEREFEERLRLLLEISNELSRAESVDELSRRAVELGRARLGFDRLGIWFSSPDHKFVLGSWGTDEKGDLVDERNIRLPAGTGPNEPLFQKSPKTFRQENVDLLNGKTNIVGRGMHAQAPMWDGEKTIGLVATDNLLHHRPITDQDAELLNLYASTLGYLTSRKRAEETLRASEQAERRFEERLRTLVEISNELSRAGSVSALCRKGVELGRSRLGFDRLGIWFYTSDPGMIQGSFGTDLGGKIIDERGSRRPTKYSPSDVLHQTSPAALFEADAELTDGEGNIIGRGALAQAAMWDGEKVIGFVSMDNAIQHRPITDQDCELLNLFASTLGYLTSRKRTEEKLQTGEHRERRFQERLRILMEIGNELSRAESMDAMCRQAVELGRLRLGFDRLGIWFYGPEPGKIHGVYGTDSKGETCDEREFSRATEGSYAEILRQTSPLALLQSDVDLEDGRGNILGRGARVQTAIWDGEKIIGLLSMDNLLRKRPITVYDCELLNSFASTFGYLCARKQAEDTLRSSEQKERVFQERLRILMEISNELSRAESVDALCRQAVELGRSRLDFDRMGIWFYSPDPGIVKGSFGTDQNGGITDERHILLRTEGMQMEILKQTRPIALLWPDAILRDGNSIELGHGMQAQAAMWNGEKVIGFVSVDNLLRKRPITDQDCELINLFASSLGYLASRKQAEDALKEYSETLEEKVEERTRALRQAQENLVRTEKLAVLGQLAATVSHEIRNPLATIRVSTTAVEQKVRDKGLGVERPLDRIQRNITRCDTIISELLEYTRMPDLNLQMVDFDEWINRLLDEQTLPEGITLRRDTASGARVPLDTERFRRVIINLLDNARQAMMSISKAEGEAKPLTVETRLEKDRLRMAVRDTGGGIAPDVLPHIFEPLYSTKGFGVGLGLSIVKGIVEQHGGTIEIMSEVGRGTDAVVRLPLTAEGKQGAEGTEPMDSERATS